MDPYQQESNSQKVIIIIAGVALLFIVILYVVVTQLINMQGQEETIAENEEQVREEPEPEPEPPQATQEATQEAQQAEEPEISPTTSPDTVIAVVGEESIYQADLDLKLRYYDEEEKQEKRQEMLDILVEESVILQAGAEDEFISLSDIYFNTPSKDYASRNQAISSVEESVKDSLVNIEAEAISIWYMNQDYVWDQGLEAAKEYAFEKIQDIYDKVITREITFEQAEQLIIEDRILGEINPAYEANARYEFSGTRETATASDFFSGLIWSLENGEISQIENLETVSNGIYAFARVKDLSRNTLSGDYENFSEWLASNKDSYKIELSEQYRDL